MNDVINQILSEVSLDERVVDGIFRMENNNHMSALRDYLVEHGIPQTDVREITNKMLEGNFPDRQAFQKDTGILVTWPSAEYKAKAFKESPGKYTDQDPNPKKDTQQEPTEKPIVNTGEPTTAPPVKQEPEPTEKTSNIFTPQQPLKVEPAGNMPAQPSEPTPIQPPQKTPEIKAAEREYIKQIFDTDNTTLSNLTPTLTEGCKNQLKILYTKADELGLREAVTFLTHYVKP